MSRNKLPGVTLARIFPERLRQRVSLAEQGDDEYERKRPDHRWPATFLLVSGLISGKKGNMMHRNTHPHSFFSSHAHTVWLGLLALSMMIMLIACGGGTTSSSGTTPTAATGNTPTATSTSASPTVNGSAIMITTDSSGSFAFSPTTLTIKVGTKVTWTNMTQAPHTVTSDDGKSFDSGISNPIASSGGTYSFTFTKAGTFPYHCQIHTSMKATIIVQ